MSTEVKVPALGESITEAVVLEWLVSPGDQVSLDQDLVVLETDKVTMPVPSPVAGVLEKQLVKPDDEVEIGSVLALVAEGKVAAKASPAQGTTGGGGPAAEGTDAGTAPLMPAVRRLLAEHGLQPSQITGSGRGGRILKEDVLAFVAATPQPSEPAAPPQASRPTAEAADTPAVATRPSAQTSDREESVKMSRLRRTIARRLVEAQQTAAILTTFNEIDMSAVKALRAHYKERFQSKHGVRLGYMSFFAKAAIEALKAFPAVNAEIRDDAVVYKNYYNIGVAVGGGKGLVVPVVRDADQLGFAEFELTLNALAAKAQANTLTMEDLSEGTFTISNGGVYGSMLSTPILNPPQSGILGLHKIEDRPVAVNGAVEIRPMMYVALSYDHRIVDGKGAVSFLVKIKEVIEDPNRILLEV